MKIGNLEIYGVVYKIENLVNGKVYIGQTTDKKGFNGRYCSKGKGIERVYNHHKNNKRLNRSYNEHLLKSVKKYGFDAFKITEIFDIAFSKEELNIKEECWISICKSNKPDYGYNIQLGGDNKAMSNETKEKLREANIKIHIGEKSDRTNYTNKQVIFAKKLISENVKTIDEICEVTGINKKVIIHINSLKRWEKVGSEYNNIIKDIRLKDSRTVNKIIKFNKLMEIVDTYNTWSEASIKNNISKYTIQLSYLFTSVNVYGYVYLKNDKYLKENIITKKNDLLKNGDFMVREIDKDGNSLGLYNSASECGMALGLDSSAILKVCKGKRKHTKGHMFKKEVCKVN